MIFAFLSFQVTLLLLSEPPEVWVSTVLAVPDRVWGVDAEVERIAFRIVEIRAGVALGGGEMSEILSGTDRSAVIYSAIRESGVRGNEIAKYAGGDTAVS